MQTLRRQDREITQDETLQILASAEYGVLSMASAEAIPYGVPLSFCFIDDCIYFHCAMEGRKIDYIENNNKVSFCAIGATQVMPAKFGTKYESAIVFGLISEVIEEEKQSALEGLIQKYSPEHIDSGAKYIAALTHKTRVFKIQPEHVSGKSRKQ